eukprot:scaffold55757_cov22-Prasinocladus_malaysianus.AAC.1
MAYHRVLKVTMMSLQPDPMPVSVWLNLTQETKPACDSLYLCLFFRQSTTLDAAICLRTELPGVAASAWMI